VLGWLRSAGCLGSGSCASVVVLGLSMASQHRCLASRHSSRWRPCVLKYLQPGICAALGAKRVAWSPDVCFCWQGAYTT
jgi:hypothetical protein